MQDQPIRPSEAYRTQRHGPKDIPLTSEPQQGLGRGLICCPANDDTLVSQQQVPVLGTAGGDKPHAKQQLPITERKWQKLLDLDQAEDNLPGLSAFLEQFAHHLNLDRQDDTAETPSIKAGAAKNIPLCSPEPLDNKASFEDSGKFCMTAVRTASNQPQVIKDCSVKDALKTVAARMGESETFNNPDIVVRLLQRYIQSLSSKELTTCMQKLEQDSRVPRYALFQLLSKRCLVKRGGQVEQKLQVLTATIIKPELEQAKDPDRLIQLLSQCSNWLSEPEFCAYVDRLADRFQVTIEKIIERLHSHRSTESQLETIALGSLMFLTCRRGLERANTEADKQSILACWLKHFLPRERPQALPLIYKHLGADQAWSQFERMQQALQRQQEPVVETDLYRQAQELWPDKVELYTDLITLITKHHCFGFSSRTLRISWPQEYAFDTCLNGIRVFSDVPDKIRSVVKCWRSVADLDAHPEYTTMLWEAYGENLTAAGIEVGDLSIKLIDPYHD